jgi:hypothetical protein
MLSILIPARNEPYLQKTLEDIERNKVLDTEVLWMEDDGRGQRMCTTVLAQKAKGDHIMKCDAHVSFGPGFDRILLEEIDDRTILAPILMPLNGQSWTINGKKQMTHYAFDTNFIMQHVQMDTEDTMCLQGSCFMLKKSNYFDWNLGDETLPSWGGQGVELGIKAFLNGGRCKTTRSTYYGHVFRHSTEEFPYDRGENPGKQATEELSRRYKNKSIAPLIEKFGYPCDWTKEAVSALL